MKNSWKAFPALQEALFERSNKSYAHLKTADVSATIRQHPDVVRFREDFAGAFNGFDQFLTQQLIESMETLSISKEEAILSDEIFDRLAGLPLVDAYDAYQALDEAWSRIAVDLEIIQTEGADAVTQVDANMVLKKKGGKDQEVQEGWIGHILPFDFVQRLVLHEDLDALQAEEDRLAEIAAAYEEALENLSEEDKEADFINEDKTAFVWAEVKKCIKAKDAEDPVLQMLRDVNAQNGEEKELKKRIKEDSAALHLKTKEALENLSEAQARELLHEKWVSPLIRKLMALPDAIVDDFASQIAALAGKYDTTLAEVEKEITAAETELVQMLDQLTGDEFDMQGLQELKRMFGGL